MDETADRELIEHCRRDRAALHGSFRALYQRHAGRALRFLRGLTGDEERAKDALQETFLRVYAALDRYDPAQPFAPWLLGIARNVALDQRRKEARRPADALTPALAATCAGPSDAPPEGAARREARALVTRAVAALPAPEREVLLLKHVEGLTFEQVAGTLGCSVRTAKYRMRAALDGLAVDLRERGLAPDPRGPGLAPAGGAA